MNYKFEEPSKRRPNFSENSQQETAYSAKEELFVVFKMPYTEYQCKISLSHFRLMEPGIFVVLQENDLMKGTRHLQLNMAMAASGLSNHTPYDIIFVYSTLISKGFYNNCH